MTKSSQLQIRVSAADKRRIRKRAAQAGMDVSAWVLRQLLPSSEQQFQACCDQVASATTDASFALAALNDLLHGLSGNDLEVALHDAPTAALTPFALNYVAAMVEHAAVLRSRRPPPWTRAVPPLEQPWFASSVRSLRLYLLTNSPPAFRSRNLFVDASVGSRV